MNKIKVKDIKKTMGLPPKRERVTDLMTLKEVSEKMGLKKKVIFTILMGFKNGIVVINDNNEIEEDVIISLEEYADGWGIKTSNGYELSVDELGTKWGLTEKELER